ncbi:MAG TPA: TGS domain-containing protein, partial [Candidatus Hydrogenedentes bacterium]|nr:TGS domain-containing protein [Candidatus Hydrogenedentota bacterium]
MMNVYLPDGSAREVQDGATALELAEQIGRRLAKDAMGAMINDEVRDLATPLKDGDRVAILTFATREGQDVFRHSASHVMATAIMRVFPETKLAIGPSIEDGFYYDIDAPRPLTEEDFAAVEAEMAKIVAADVPFVRREAPKAEAEKFFSERGETYKLELIR